MDRIVEKTGKTVQEAVTMALEELNTDRDNVDVEILDEGKQGIFGILSKQARVRVTLKDIMTDSAADFLTRVLDKMKVDASVESVEEDDSLLLKITGKDSGIIIGRRGETLDALQYLASLVVNKNRENYVRVTVDIENYRKKREETLVKLANRLAERVTKYKKKVTLEPMNPYERRIIHSTLQNNKHIETYSIGEEPNRRVVISLK